MVNKLLKGIFLSTLFFASSAYSQDDDLLSDEPSTQQNEPVKFAFKTTKVVNLQSLEMLGAGVFDFKMNHRFGAFNAGASEAFGLDQATVRMGGEYGILPNLMIGVGRNNVAGLKNYDGYLKYRICQQTTNNKIPVTVLVLGSIEQRFGNSFLASLPAMAKMTNVFQIIIGRKFNEYFSMQLSPSYLMPADKKMSSVLPKFALGIGMRQKLTKRTTLNLEYIPILTNKGKLLNSFSAGFDIETGGHVFQVHFTNSIGLNEAQFIGNTTSNWSVGGIRFGFNLSRVFTIVDPSRFKK